MKNYRHRRNQIKRRAASYLDIAASHTINGAGYAVFLEAPNHHPRRLEGRESRPINALIITRLVQSQCISMQVYSHNVPTAFVSQQYDGIFYSFYSRYPITTVICRVQSSDKLLHLGL